MIPLHAAAPLQTLVVTPPLRACDACRKAKDEVLSREPWAIGWSCFDCRRRVVGL